MEILPFGTLESRCAAAIRADLESRSEPIGPIDVLIAGTAFAHAAFIRFQALVANGNTRRALELLDRLDG